MNPVYENKRKELLALIQKRNNITAQITSDTEQTISLGLQDLFAKHPKLECFMWTQRDGEYNDEGPDVGVSLGYVDANGIKNETDGWNASWRPRTGGDPEWEAARAAIIEFLNVWDQQAMFDIFGEYAFVKASKTGVDIIDYWDYDGYLESYLEEMNDEE